MHTPLFEVCLEGVDGALAAARGGAHRIELCAALVEGGITPSIGTIQACRDAVDLDIMVMIRPRGGDFLYTPAELDDMAHNIEACRSIGVTGVVFGLLTEAGDVDAINCRELMSVASNLSVTFHRAFDVARQPFQQLETLVELGVSRLLTSGQAATVPEGVETIRRLVEKADERLVILPGCGITPENVRSIIAQTGVREFHATAFKQLTSGMRHRNEAVYMGIPGLPEYERSVTSTTEVERFLNAFR